MNTHTNQSLPLSGAFLNAVSNLEFSPITDSEVGLKYLAQESVPIFQIIMDSKERTNRIANCQDFFKEITDKLEVKAMELIPTVIISKDLSNSIEEQVATLLHRIYTGDPCYLPHLYDNPSIEWELRMKGVVVKIAFVIHEDENNYRLLWILQTESLILNPLNSEEFITNGILESIYS